jgi:hypothetical protein
MLARASSFLLADLASDLSHRSGQFFKRASRLVASDQDPQPLTARPGHSSTPQGSTPGSDTTKVRLSAAVVRA